MDWKPVEPWLERKSPNGTCNGLTLLARLQMSAKQNDQDS
jgi:hypothetical protein